MGQTSACCSKQPQKVYRQEVPKQIIEKFYPPTIKCEYKQLPHPYCPDLYGEFQYIAEPARKVYLKVPVSYRERTKFTWEAQDKWQYPLQKLKSLSEQAIKQRTFQQKYAWFITKLEAEKSKYGPGYNKLRVDPTNVLLSSNQGFNQINFNLQTKIVFTDDKGAIDAGGLFRQWVNMCMIEAFSPELGMFKLCETDQTAYKFVANKITQKIFVQYARIIGFVIGKSMIERIPLNCYLNRTILRMIANQPIHLNDVYNYDIDIYNSMKSILDYPISEQDLISFTCKIKDPFTNEQKQVQLIKNGRQTYVNDQNKQQFVKKMIQFYCYQSIQPIFKALRTSLYEVIPYKYLEIFQPFELQMVICGRQEIDVNDWRKYTEYKGYSVHDEMIVWFWEILQKFDDNLKSNLLHFCTGSSKVPISGFRYLQCRRGKVKLFNIKKVELNPVNPYPKGITCFNKLQLPRYQSKQQLQSMLLTVCQEQIHDFGLDNAKH